MTDLIDPRQGFMRPEYNDRIEKILEPAVKELIAWYRETDDPVDAVILAHRASDILDYELTMARAEVAMKRAGRSPKAKLESVRLWLNNAVYAIECCLEKKS